MIDRRTFLLTPLALAAAERTPNVLLLVASGWRGQATPWAGDPDLVAPNLERFGKESVVFPRAYSCYPSAAPARSALMTGRFPHSISPSGEVTIDAVMKSAISIVYLDPPKSFAPYDPAQLHPRQNVPPAAEAAARRNLANRYGMYAALDAAIGRQLAGLAKDTIVVFTSDRGEQMGSQGLDGDNVAFEESVRIPLAIRYPRALPQGSVSDLLVSQADILPTLLGLCGVPAPDGVQGRDLSALISGKKGERPESVYAEGKIGQKDEWRMLALGSDKIVVNAQTEATHLYNLADDPYEMTNLVREPAVKLKRDELLAVLRASGRKLGDFKSRA